MAYAWSSELETGNAVIDNQHKQLFVALNALFDAYRSGGRRQEVERTMEFLLGYTVKHFADEEELQRKCDYPDYYAHRQLHIDFKGVAQDLVNKMPQEGPTDEFITMVYAIVGEWLFKHIKGDDFRMVAYMQAAKRLRSAEAK